jgi:hypothetical protein
MGEIRHRTFSSDRIWPIGEKITIHAQTGRPRTRTAIVLALKSERVIGSERTRLVGVAVTPINYAEAAKFFTSEIMAESAIANSM